MSKNITNEKPKKSDTIAIVVPVYKKDLSPDEEISLKHLGRFLHIYDNYIIAPDDLALDFNDFQIIRFSNECFKSVDSFSKLMLSSQFYESFIDYEYILIYQLDCLVFKDDLLKWCNAGFDYIGAPLFKSKSDASKGFSRVGNGGLSLRKVESFLKVLNSKRYIEEPVSFVKDFFFARLEDIDDLTLPARFIKRLKVLRQIRYGIKYYASNYTLNEDHFWSDRAKLFCPDFKIAPVEVGLQFSFEQFPKYCYEKNEKRLPFGCHAWAKWDRNFWEPFLLR